MKLRNTSNLFSCLRIKKHSSKSKSSYADAKAPSIPPLPLELWQHIFSLVCRLPGNLQFELLDPFIQGTFLPVTEDEEQSAARDRKNIQLVCKMWRVISVEFAYASLVICCRKHIMPLIELLEATYQSRDDGGYGRWIKELEFRMGSCENANNGPEQILTSHEITRIIRCTPNLHIYRNSNYSQQKMIGKRTHRNVLASLGRYCGNSLIRLEWSGSECPRWDDLEVLLHEVPNLQTLSCLHVYRSSDYILQLRENRAPVRLRHLKTLSLGLYPQACNPANPSWDQILGALACKFINRQYPSMDSQLPSLQRLSIVDIDLVSYSSISRRFFTTYGNQLVFLHTHNLIPKAWTPEADGWNSWNASLRDLFNLCTQLRSFIFNPVQPLIFASSHTTLERIALYPPSLSKNYYPDEEEDIAMYNKTVLMPVDKALQAISVADFPRLRSIRLNDTDTFEPLNIFERWLESWVPIWETKGVRFENNNGLTFAMTQFHMEGINF